MKLHQALLLLALSPATTAASTFELSGTVLDTSGTPLTGATLTLVHSASGLVRTTTSNDSGLYTFAGMLPGEYTLEARLDGFATSRFAGLRYFADTKPIFNVTLNLRAVQESTTFTGEAPLVNVSHSQVGLSLEERQLHELPLTSRSYLELVSVEGAAHEISESVPGAPVFGAPLQSVSGANAHYTSYRLDGFSNTRDQHGVVHVDVDVEGVEEFRVISGQFSAEYGRSLAGIVSATTSAGGADFHGSVYAYVRPGGWDADDPLTGTDTSLDRQDLGLTFSGPIREDRTQFFASFSYRNEDEDVIVTAPYDNERFSGLFTMPTTRYRGLFKLSHLFDRKHQLAIKAAFSDLERAEGVGGFDIFANRLDVRNDDASIHGTLVSELGNALSELRFGFSSERYDARGQPPPLGAVMIFPTEGNIGNPTGLERADEKHLELSDTLSFQTGNHSLVTGFSILRIESRTELVRYDDGVFYFAPNENERPILYYQSGVAPGGEATLERDETHFQIFFQDDWQLTPSFTVNLGLRWEKETSVPDNDNVAPRLGLHWDPTEDGRTSVRAGYGIFYSFVFSIVDTFESLYGPEGRRTVALTPSDRGFLRAPRGAASNFYVDAKAFAPNERRSPRAQHFTVGFERELAETWTAAVDVSHIRGSDLILPVDLNAPSFFEYSEGATRSGSEADRTRPFGAPGLPIPPGVLPALPDGYPFGRYRDLYLLSSRGSSRFWGVKLNVTKRYARELMVQAVYNWSRTENDGDDFRVLESLPLDPSTPDLEWGASAVDIPHSFVLNGVWDAPFDFRVTGLARVRSGRTVDPRVDEDLDGDRKLRERASRPGAILERNSFRTRTVASVDLSIGRLWEVGDAGRIEAALSIFNLTNRLNPKQFLRSHGRSADTPLASFLDIVQAAPPRQLQLSLRFLF